MFRRAAMAAPPSDSELRVQKVDKLDLVVSCVLKEGFLVLPPNMAFNILTKLQVYPSPKTHPDNILRPAAGGDHGAGRKFGGDSGSRNTSTSSSRGIVSIEDINKRSENYIRDRKRMFFGQN